MRLMLKIFLFLFCWIFLQNTEINAKANFIIKRTDILPAKFYVGDTAEVRIKIKPDGKLNIKKLSKTEQYSWIDIKDTEIKKYEDDIEIKIKFIPYVPGTKILPRLKFGDIVLENIKIKTESLIENTNAVLSEPADQVLLPGTRLIVAFLVCFLLGIPVASFFSLGWFKKNILLLLMKYKEQKPAKKLLRNLHNLSKNSDKLSVKEFYTILVECFKDYIQKKIAKDLSFATSLEIAALCRNFKTAPLPDKEIYTLLEKSDACKFGGEKSGKKEMESDIKNIESLVNIIEQHLREKGVKHAHV